MMRLYSVKKNKNKVSTELKDLWFFNQIMECSERSALSARILSLGIIELCQHICLEDFNHSDSKDSARISLTNDRMRLVLNIVVNLTDSSIDSCQRVIDIDFHKDLFDFLRAESLDPEKVEFCEWHSSVADSIMTVLYNVIQVFNSKLTAMSINE
jgi:hypothetical protein